MSKTHQSIRGMHDILPAQMGSWHHLERVVDRVLAQYGFREIRAPILEKTDVFTRAIGQATDVVEKEMYTFADRNGDSLSLRPEGTAGIVRAALQNGLLYAAPERLWYRGPMFRHERPQKGRTRQFHQIGAEVFGAQGPDVDAELLLMGTRIWEALGLKGIELQINTLGNSDERQEYRAALVDFMAGHRDHLDDESWQRVERNPLRILDSKDGKVQELLNDAPVLTDYLGEASKAHFAGLRRILDGQDVPYVVNPRLVRGLDYYCHSVFEWVTSDLGAQGTICAGGRYDGLVELQGGKPFPATGFAMGMERLVALLELNETPPSIAIHGYLVLVGEEAKQEGIALAEHLRTECPHLNLICNAGDGSFKSQFKRADRSGAELAVVIAGDEVENRTVSIKFLRSDGEQISIPFEQCAHWFADWLEKPAN